MSVTRRAFQKVSIGGLDCVAAVETGAGVIAGFATGVTAAKLRAAAPEAGGLRQVGQGLLARLPSVDGPLSKAETGLFEGKNALLAVRNGETAAAAKDWLDYHGRFFDAEAAVILDRDAPGGSFADELAALGPSIPTIVVTADRPLGRPDAPDARHPSLAPGAPRRDVPPLSAWHAPISETVIFELLRYRFLSKVRAVVLLNIGDLVVPDRDGTPFDRAVRASGQIVVMHGIETYPWRLRQGRPAPHSDHLAMRRGEKRWLVSWCAAPAAMPGEAIWQPARPTGVAAAEVRPVQFRRAMGVTFPGVPVNRLVRKADLSEDASLVSLANTHFGARPIRLPRPTLIAPRRETRQVSVVTAMKNEGPFILDWIAHNRAIGIDRHLVYTNDCEDGTDRLLDLLAEAGVARRDNPYRLTGQVPQFAAFQAALKQEDIGAADWLMTLDVDEYINIHVGEGLIADLLHARPEAHVFSLPWRLFGNSNCHHFEDRPVTEQFTAAAPAFAPRPLQAWAFKSIYRNDGLFRRLGVHRPNGIAAEVQGQLVWVDGSGRPMPPTVWHSAWRMSKSTWGYDLASLNHYAVRSAESFLVKRDRGRVNHTDREQGLAYWFRMNHNAEAETSIQRLAPRVRKEKDRLLSLPGVAEAHAEAVDWHRARIAQLMRVPEHAELYALITTERMEKLSRMATLFGANVYLEGPDVIPDEIVARDPAKPFFFTVPRSEGHKIT